jgi:cyclophilin family peptidyl-prolyl cis-trans isomerase
MELAAVALVAFARKNTRPDFDPWPPIDINTAMQLTRILNCAALFVSLLVGSVAAQEKSESNQTGAAEAQSPSQPASSASPEEARGQFDRVYGEWKNMMSRLAELNTKYQTAGDAERPNIEKEYDQESARGMKLAEQLKEAALAAFAADPKDKEVSDLMSVMARSAYLQDDYEEVNRFAQPLLKFKVNEPQISWFAANAAIGLHNFAAVVPLVQKALTGGANKELQKAASELAEAAAETAPLWPIEQKIREREAKDDDLPRVKLQTSKGDITIELFENEAPNTVASFISLVEKGFYDGVPFHRVLPQFMAQGGDPTGKGNGGPGYRIKDEFDNPGARMHFRGTLSMANSGKPNTNGSQFFLTFRPTPHLNGRHTVFGRVLDGFDVLPKITRIDPEKPSGVTPDKIVKATVIRKRDHEYKPETLPDN